MASQKLRLKAVLLVERPYRSSKISVTPPMQEIAPVCMRPAGTTETHKNPAEFL